MKTSMPPDDEAVSASGRGGELAGIGILPGVGDNEPCSIVGVETSLDDKAAPKGTLIPDGTKGIGEAPTIFSGGGGNVNESSSVGDMSGLDPMEVGPPFSSDGVETPELTCRTAFSFACLCP
jgi:hypothetical protein